MPKEPRNRNKRNRRALADKSSKTKKKGRNVSSRAHPALKHFFEKIGTPRSEQFIPDDFQIEALKKLKTADVLVSTPTGTGKTWIALQAIREYVAQGKKTWYTAPLKALSNAKYQEFCEELGSEDVGILTGDRKENPDAPVIVGTTEILRNQLYDGMYLGSDIDIDFVVLDEAHYLGDPERGVVWEEILIYLPHRVKILLLSATFRNSGEIAQWLSEMRGTPCSVVTLEKRPVPLVPLFLFPDGSLTPLSDHKGLLPQIKEFQKTTARSRRYRYTFKADYGTVVEQLRIHNLLPAVFFLKSRRECDEALQSRFFTIKSTSADDEAAYAALEPFFEQYPILRRHRQLPELIHGRIAAHHAGQLPQWKMVIEKMMHRGSIDAIFATSTVAAGVDFPARSVVLVQSDRYNGKEFISLTATELHQMTGRAGRRGKDKIGFAVVVPGVFQDPALINTLLESPPEPIKSQIQTNFSMALNLLLTYRPAEIMGLLDRSLAAFQSAQPQIILKKQLEQPLGDMAEILDACALGKRERKTAKKFLAELQTEKSTALPCLHCSDLARCNEKKRKRLKTLSARARRIMRRIDRERHRIWLDFERHLSFLKETGFATPDDYLTADGMWASQLRIDQPLLIAECIRQKVFDDYSPEILAGLIAPFVNDKMKAVEVNLGQVPASETLINAFETMVLRLKPMRSAMLGQGFAVPALQLWPAVALYLWARGTTWYDLLEMVEMEEGDLAMLILRTADHLRQVRNLEPTHPGMAQKAHQVLPEIIREPVWGY